MTHKSQAGGTRVFSFPRSPLVITQLFVQAVGLVHERGRLAIVLSGYTTGQLYPLDHVAEPCHPMPQRLPTR